MTHVWYVCYGSNLWWDRFRCYLEGGTAPGSKRVNPGARDSSAPLADEPLEIPHRLIFAGPSSAWDGGGVAFLGESDQPLATLARRYLVTAEQFSDIVAQECLRPPGTDLDIEEITRAGSGTAGSGWYDLVLCLGDHDGIPLMTFTSSRLDDLEPTPPSAAYTATLVNGLVESHGMTKVDAQAYVAERSVL